MCDLHARDADQNAQPLEIEDFVDELVVSLTNVRIYGRTHPRVRAILEALEKALETLLGKTGAAELELGAVDGYIVHERRALLGATLGAQRLLEPLQRLDSGGIALERGTRADDFLALAHLLGRRMQVPENLEAAGRELEAAGCRSIRLLPAYRLPGSDENEQASIGKLLAQWASPDAGKRALELDVPVKLYQRVVDHLQEVMIKVCRREAIGLEQSHSLIEAVLKRMGVDPGTMLDLCRYERYDAFTFGHSIRVCLLALFFARSMTRNQDLLHRIGIAALMHDIGKAWVPFEILHSVSRLSDEEREEMGRHTVHGGQILTTMQAEPSAVATAFGHHRFGDHGGYPKALHEAQLSTITRMVKICDVYEALTSVRPYKDPMSPVRAYRIMISMRDHFDPGLLRQFIGVNGVYPVGAHVRLSSGERARVVAQTSWLERPKVLLETTPDGARLESDPGETIDLSASDQRARRAVVQLYAQKSLDIAAAA